MTVTNNNFYKELGNFIVQTQGEKVDQFKNSEGWENLIKFFEILK